MEMSSHRIVFGKADRSSRHKGKNKDRHDCHNYDGDDTTALSQQPHANVPLSYLPLSAAGLNYIRQLSNN